MSRAPIVCIQRHLLAIFMLAVIAASLFGSSVLAAQDKESKSKSKQAKSQPAKAEAAAAKEEPSPTTKDDTAEESKGPWHGLTWRLVGPFRGGRVLAVSGVVGDTHTYYFGGTPAVYGRRQMAELRGVP